MDKLWITLVVVDKLWISHCELVFFRVFLLFPFIIKRLPRTVQISHERPHAGRNLSKKSFKRSCSIVTERLYYVMGGEVAAGPTLRVSEPRPARMFWQNSG